MNYFTLRCCLIVAMVTGVFSLGMLSRQALAADRTAVAMGETLFQEKCSPCHTIGGGRLMGPDLKGVTALRDHAWLRKFIATPDRVLASGDPIATQLLKEYGGIAMPNMGLSNAQVDALLAFLATDSVKGETAPPAAPPQTTGGDQRRGIELFTGVRPLQQRGAPCLACHTISNIAPLGGGSLGPDLTGVYQQFGTAGLASLLASLPFPTMRPIYDSRPLTTVEQEDLAALFQTAAGRQPTDATARILIVALVGFMLLLLLAGIIWRQRIKGVRRALGQRATKTGGNRR